MRLKPRPAIYFLIPYLLGIIVGEYTTVPLFWTWLFTLICLSCAALFQWFVRLKVATGDTWRARLQSKVILYVLIHLAVFVSGILRLDIGTLSSIPTYFYDQPVSFSGRTEYQPERGKKWEACYAKGELQLLETGETVQTKVLIRFQGLMPLRYGKRLTLTGTLHRPQPQRNPGGFDYRAYLARKDVSGIIYHQGLFKLGEQAGFPPLRWIERLRLRTEEVIDEAYTDELHTQLIKGILLGKRSDLPTDTLETFRNSGNFHVLAVSGLHVGFIAAFCYFGLSTLATVLGMLAKHPHLTKKGIALLTIGAVCIYACLVGFRPSVCRASLMAILFLLATIIDRDADIFNLLAFAALILLLLNPTQLWDIGFQLSFVAVTAILYFVPKMEKLFHQLWEPPESPNLSVTLGRGVLKWLILSYLVTLAALLGTTLIIAFHFFRAYPIGIIVGPFAVGLVSLILAIGLGSVGAGLFSLLPLAKLLASFNAAIISLFLAIIGLFGNASVVLKMTPPTFGIFVVYIAVCLGITHWRFCREQWRLATLIGLTVVAIWVWDRAFHEEGRLLEVVTLDVGQGDAAVVKFPDGRTMLVDGGDRRSYYNEKKKQGVDYDVGERVVAPYLDANGIRELALVVLSHQDSDHGGGLAYILENFKVKRVLGIAEADKARSSATLERLRKIAQDDEIDYAFEYAGEIEMTPTATLNLLHPIDAASTDLMDSDTNDDSLVMRLSYGEVDILFTGDIGAKAETRLIATGQDLHAEVLKVPHHGSRTSSTTSFLDAVQPKYALFSLGIRNRYGFPDAGVVARYRERGCVLLRTDELGAITLKTDGKRCWFRSHVAENELGLR